MFLHAPAERLTNVLLLFFLPDSCVFVFFGILHNSVEKTKCHRFGRGIQNTCKISGSYYSSKKRLDILDLCAVNMQKLRLRIVITWFQCRFDFGHYIRLNIGPAQSVRIFARNFVRACLGAPGSGSFRKKMRKKNIFPRKRLPVADLFEGL